jgi:hypothetical protein
MASPSYTMVLDDANSIVNMDGPKILKIMSSPDVKING